jgi:hypothetical protein
MQNQKRLYIYHYKKIVFLHMLDLMRPARSRSSHGWAVPQPVTDSFTGPHWAVLCPDRPPTLPRTYNTPRCNIPPTSPYTHTSPYENSHQEFSEFTYSSYQTLHPGGATHYKFLASNVSLCLTLPLSCLLFDPNL